MNELSGQTVLVTGSTGHVGWGIATAAHAAGARLVLPTRSANGVARLEHDFPDATIVLADVGDPSDQHIILDAIDGQLDHVAAPMGSWWQGGETIDQPRSVLDDLLATYVSAQLQLLGTVAEQLRRAHGSYTLVTGAGGEHLIPSGGALVVAVRAQYALAEVLRHELNHDALRFNELRIMGRLEREPRPGIIPSAVAGEAFVELMTSPRRSRLVRYPE